MRDDEDTSKRPGWGAPVVDGGERRRASKLEVLGSWLGLWTAPRGVEVPPVPWAKVALVALGVVVVAGAAVALIAPEVDETKRRSAADEARAEREQKARSDRAIAIEQRARRGRLAGADRVAAVALVEKAIGRDARARFDPDARRAECEVAGDGRRPGRVRLRCSSTTTDIVGAGEQEGARGALAIPYLATVDLRARRYAFCKVNPPPGEQIVPDPRDLVAVPAACTA